MDTSTSTKVGVDAVIATGVISTPLWLQLIEQGFQVFMLMGGAALLCMRIWITVKELRSKKKDD